MANPGGVPDWGKVGNSYKKGVAKMLVYGIVAGDKDGNVTPTNTAGRRDGAGTMCNSIKALTDMK